MARLSLLLALLPGLAGCQFFRAVHITARSMFQTAPDYDAIEARALAREALPAASPGLASGWTEFRGPGRRGEAVGVRIQTTWPTTGLSLAWRRPAGATYGSFVAEHGLVFTLEQRRDQEALVAYAAESGDEVWTSSWDARYRDAPSGEGPRSTPVLGGDKVLGLGATGKLRCVDARTGALCWQRDVLEIAGAENLEYGLAATPLIVDDLVIVPTGRPRSGGSTMIALRLEDGGTAWKALDDAASCSSPMLATVAGTRQILYLSATRLVGVDPATGRLLWAASWSQRNGYNCAQPIVVGPEDIVLSSAYGKGAARLRVTRVGDAWSTEEVWRTARFKNRFNPSVLHEGFIYGLDEGVLACLDVATGKRRWKGGRYGYGQLLLVDGHLIVLSDEGEVALVPATPTGFTERARFRAFEGLSVQIPAIAYGRLLVRNKAEIACFELGPVGPSTAAPGAAPTAGR